MKRFQLHRDEDVSGVSGTGVVAEGVAFSDDGPVALRWTSEWPTSVVFHDRGVESLVAVHGHNGRTRIVWLDHEQQPSDDVVLPVRELAAVACEQVRELFHRGRDLDQLTPRDLVSVRLAAGAMRAIVDVFGEEELTDGP